MIMYEYECEQKLWLLGNVFTTNFDGQIGLSIYYRKNDATGEVKIDKIAYHGCEKDLAPALGSQLEVVVDQILSKKKSKCQCHCFNFMILHGLGGL